MNEPLVNYFSPMKTPLPYGSNLIDFLQKNKYRFIFKTAP